MVTESPGEQLDPRVERSRRLIRESALNELADAGYGGFTIEAVAARAGVGRSTVYRHWTNKLVLIADALETLNEQPAPDATEGTARERVEGLLRHLTEALTGSTLARCIPALIEAAEHDSTVRDFLHRYSARRRQALIDAIVAGIDAGDFPASIDPEIASAALSGALFYRRLMTSEPLNPALVPVLTQTVLSPRST